MSRKSDGESENLDMLLRQARESEFPLAGIPIVYSHEGGKLVARAGLELAVAFPPGSDRGKAEALLRRMIEAWRPDTRP